MEHDFSFSSKTKRQYHGLCWEVASPAGLVFIVHGLGESSDHYGRVAEFFNRNHLSVYALDMPGHGRETGTRGHIGSRTKLFSDLNECIGLIRAKHSRRPLFMYGHSLGGNLVLDYRLRGYGDVDAYIVTSPWIELAFPLKTYEVIGAQVLGCIAPRLRRASSGELQGLTSDPSFSYTAPRSAEFDHAFITMKTASDAHHAAGDILATAAEDHPKVLLQHGTDDPICSVDGSRAFAEIAGDKCVYIEHPGCFHELHNDKARDALLQNELDFMQPYIKSYLS